ncbi:Uncharacterized protein Adt_23315 [Abeliophyllum distichum]|uniref:Uncharacterized protein n=1 Tax=Abeliophyllum distichum TaxID=126358 RepID=A0ABD1SAR3_9LAMI
MADVLNHGGDGGDEPPHQHANSLQADCQIDGQMFQRNEKARATGYVYEFFDINPRRYSKDDYKHVVDGIEDTSARRYRQYKAKVIAYIRDKGTTVPYRGLTADVWEKCIERSSSKKFKDISMMNKVNKEKINYTSLQGSKTIVATRFDMWDRQTQEWPSVIETFKVRPIKEIGEWVNERASARLCT